jgi:hypothetical protein
VRALPTRETPPYQEAFVHNSHLYWRESRRISRHGKQRRSKSDAVVCCDIKSTL